MDENPDTRQFSCVLSADAQCPSCLLLTDASDTYLSLRGLDRSYLGSEIRAVFNYRDVLALELLFHRLQHGADSLVYFREFGGLVWQVEALYRVGSVTFLGSELRSVAALNRAALTCQLCQPPPELLQKCPAESILLRAEGETLQVESLSPKLARLTGLSRNCGLAALWSCLYSLNPEGVARACLSSGVGTRYVDIYSRGGQTRFLLLEYLPLCHAESRVVINIRQLGEDEFFSLQQRQLDFAPERTPLRVWAAYGLFAPMGDRFELRRYNHIFAELLRCDGAEQELTRKLLSPCVAADGQKCDIAVIGGSRYYCAAAMSNGEIHLYMLPFSEFQSGIDQRLQQLTPREREITLCVIDGLSTREIARKLFIADGTVKKTVSNIYAKLGVSSKIELIHQVLQY